MRPGLCEWPSKSSRETAPLSYNLWGVVYPGQSKMNVSVILSKGDWSVSIKCTVYTYRITGIVKKNVDVFLAHPEAAIRSAASSASPLTGDKSILTVITQNVSLFVIFWRSILLGIYTFARLIMRIYFEKRLVLFVSGWKISEKILIRVNGSDSSTRNSVKKSYPGWRNPFWVTWRRKWFLLVDHSYHNLPA